MSPEGKCVWSEFPEIDDCGNWDTGCGNAFILSEGTPSENEFKFCPYCGREIEESKRPRPYLADAEERP